MTARVVVLTKSPEPGRVKTRLAADIGPRSAATLHEAMVWETLERAKASGLPVTVSLDGPLDSSFAQRLVQDGIAVEAQAKGDLGARLRHALRHPGRQLALGSDCVVFDPDWLRKAAEATETVTLGKSMDGGYWTIGGNLAQSDLQDLLFDNMEWSVETVANETLERLRTAGKSVLLLPDCYDVDTITDLHRLSDDPRCVGRLRDVVTEVSAPISR